MSRWLQSAASLLETLDDVAGKAIVEQRERRQQLLLQDGDGAGDLDAEEQRLGTILAARGLGEENDANDDGSEGEVDGDNDGGMQESEHQKVLSDDTATDAWGDDGIGMSSRSVDVDDGPTERKPDLSGASAASKCARSAEDETDMHAVESPFRTDSDYRNKDPQTDTEQGQQMMDPTKSVFPDELSLQPEEDPQTVETGSGSVPMGSSSRTASGSHLPSAAYSRDLQLIQKEAKKLKRHVLALNQQLEASEQEVEAQRRELESVAILMGKERAKFKADRELQAEQHQADLKLLRQRHEEQTKELQSQIESLHRQRAQEGGNWSKELEEALERELETLRQVALLQDEKETLQQHIDTLESQQQALGSRLESLTETADTATERERQAEIRLDELLTAHARQIQQRQLREAELEKTISELGAALVKAQAHEAQAHEAHGADNIAPLQASTSDMMVESLRTEMETIQTQLLQEQQRNKILQDELRSVSAQQSDEVTVLQLQKEQHDRQIHELNETVLQLKKELREREVAGSARLNGDGETAKQINDWSEEVFRLREKVSSLSSETSTLKSRLHVALDRAKRAEQALEDNVTSAVGFQNIDLESGSNRRRLNGSKGHPTMRAALKLDVINGERTERIAKTLDSLDAFLIQSGRFLRYNAVARLLFILYFILIHLWTSILLFVHVHGYETIHGDYGIGVHGPAGLMPMPIGNQFTQKTDGA